MTQRQIQWTTDMNAAVSGLRVVVVPLLALLLTWPCPAQDAARIARHKMVAEVIASEGIQNERVLEAMRTVPRHEFVPVRLRSRAYFDEALPIGSKQTISPPYIVAYMTEAIDPQPTDRVLEIGTGSGYQAAVLSHLVEHVYSIEIVKPLAKSAKERLEDLGYRNVTTKQGDGYLGWAEHAPFDKVIVTCSPEQVPKPLVEQLREGGMMIIPLGERYQQSFYVMEKRDGKLVQTKLIPTLFVPMTGESEEQRNVQPDGRRPEVVNGGFELDDNEDGRADGWHYQRQTEICGDAPIRGFSCLRFTNDEPGRMSQCLQGLPLDGARVGAINVSIWIRHESVVPGKLAYETAGMHVIFYDSIRRTIDTRLIGPWRGSLDWQRVKATVPVPPNTKEMIIRVGLNGATGQLDADEVLISPVYR